MAARTDGGRGRLGSGQKLVGPMDLFEKDAEFAGVLFAGAGLYAAGDVHGIGANGSDGFGHVFRSQAACQNDPLSERRLSVCMPILIAI